MKQNLWNTRASIWELRGEKYCPHFSTEKFAWEDWKYGRKIFLKHLQNIYNSCTGLVPIDSPRWLVFSNKNNFLKFLSWHMQNWKFSNFVEINVANKCSLLFCFVRLKFQARNFDETLGILKIFPCNSFSTLRQRYSSF